MSHQSPHPSGAVCSAGSSPPDQSGTLPACRADSERASLRLCDRAAVSHPASAALPANQPDHAGDRWPAVCLGQHCQDPRAQPLRQAWHPPLHGGSSPGPRPGSAGTVCPPGRRPNRVNWVTHAHPGSLQASSDLGSERSFSSRKAFTGRREQGVRSHRRRGEEPEDPVAPPPAVLCHHLHRLAHPARWLPRRRPRRRHRAARACGRVLGRVPGQHVGHSLPEGTPGAGPACRAPKARSARTGPAATITPTGWRLLTQAKPRLALP